MSSSPMTLARDVVWKFVSYRPLQRLARLPYTSQRLLEYQALNMNSEDIMVGRVLYEVRYSNLYIVTEGVCRFHDIHKGEKLSNVKPISVAVHHVLEGDYAQLMERFGDDIAPIAQRFARVRERYLTFPCKQWLHERLIYYSRLVA
ncbi:putative UDP-Gal or UDP-GlcNAc-dependent glycosyltransferase [Trypanosoma grayi]|uniref:putative UDP-Gal or UDP-GlcNAc-dependent glycosyltransferase n=1 Tax=Trypanosoma grayi TaxID=71804 RepID=UPI0004F426B3|nr:putative UDP-Gal or UDP-GlcNAc-dependent glycosyltransferase [Trypanosoma grayi]KEG05819.1 putative UDP-Gal or UDP-GlcNAc-dependent glycosyltransferase [Trypanosoma grayi]